MTKNKKQLHIGDFDKIKGYKNISLKIETYQKIFDLSHSILGTPISVAKTIEYLADNYNNAVNYEPQNNVNIHIPKYLPIKRIAGK